MADAAPDSVHLELDGVSALIVPATPDRSVMNAVCYESAEALAAAYDQLAAAYDDAAISAWTVWVPEADREAAGLLERAGHALDAAPAVMCATIEELELDPGLPDALDWHLSDSLADLVPVAGKAFGFDLDAMARAVCQPTEGAMNYIAHVDGEPAGTVMAFDEDGDCGIYWVATDERARGRGICRGLMTAALLDARERGCRSTSLQATKAGYPIYARLGYRDFGPIEMWEKRGA
jgi:ribosomal protein S18 acetylase RimI-like enzyme